MIGKGLTRGLVTRLGLSLGRKTLGGWSPSSLFVNGQ